MTDALATPPTTGLEGYTPDVMRMARQAAEKVVADEAARDALEDPTGAGPGKPTSVSSVKGVKASSLASPAPLAPTVDALSATDAVSSSGTAHGIPATTNQVLALSQVPQPGSVLPVNQNSAIGQLLHNMLGSNNTSLGLDPTTGSNWTNPNDIRVVLPVMRSGDDKLGSTIEMLPGRDQSWATVHASTGKADDKLNFDGLQGSVRLGIAGPLVAPQSLNLAGSVPPNPLELQWAEFKVGAEGLVFTGRIQNGSISVSGFDLEDGYFKTKVDGLSDWATHHLAIVIPVGAVAAGGAVLAVRELAMKTGNDISLPLRVKVYDHNGLSLTPMVRPIFNKDGGFGFGGAEMGVGYTVPGKVSLAAIPGYNNDPNIGAKGFSIGARANIPMPFNGVAGVEGRVDQQGHVSVFAGVGFTF